MSKNKQGFRSTWRTLTELGQTFGVSAVKLGNLLKAHGLREKDGEPSDVAIAGNFVQKISPKQGKPYYLWHSEKTTQHLVRQGVEKVGVSSKVASNSTEARKLARSYIEAQKLDDEGSKLGYMMFCDLVDGIKKVGLDSFNAALRSSGYKGDDFSLDGWE